MGAKESEAVRAYVVKRSRGDRTEWAIKYRPPGEDTWKIRKASTVAREFRLGLDVRTRREAERVARKVHDILEGEQRQKGYEWCADTWHDTYEGRPTDGSAWGDSDDGRSVLRGGDYGSNPHDLRAAKRGWNPRGGAWPHQGLRPACSLP
jgi:hypothetical protein